MNISKENCRKMINEYDHITHGDVYSKAAAWSIVYQFCHQNGMGCNSDTGIENVIGFIESLLNKKQTQTQTT